MQHKLGLRQSGMLLACSLRGRAKAVIHTNTWREFTWPKKESLLTEMMRTASRTMPGERPRAVSRRIALPLNDDGPKGDIKYKTEQ